MCSSDLNQINSQSVATSWKAVFASESDFEAVIEEGRQKMKGLNYDKFIAKDETVAMENLKDKNDFAQQWAKEHEVENDHCLKDLTENSPLREAGYRYVMTDSPDERGIDVALLYQRGTFKLVGKNCISVPYKEIERRPTRDILHVTGQVASGDTLDVFVCHMPSRAGGEEKSEPYRLFTGVGGCVCGCV